LKNVLILCTYLTIVSYKSSAVKSYNPRHWQEHIQQKNVFFLCMVWKTLQLAIIDNVPKCSVRWACRILWDNNWNWISLRNAMKLIVFN
jgi:hypothetical protein